MKVTKIPISVRGLIMLLILLNPLFALFLDGIAMYRYVLEPFLTVLLLLEATKNRKRFNRDILVLIFAILSTLYAILIGADKAKLYLHLFCYLNAIFFFGFIAENSNQNYVYMYCKSKLKLLKVIVFFTNIVEAFMMITRRGYTDRYRWGGTFFQGTSSMPHTLSYLMLVVISMTIIIIMIENKKIWAFASLIPFLAIFQSGARISIVLALLLFLMIIDQALTSKQKSIFFKILIVGLVVALGLYLFRDRIISSSLWAKLAVRSGGSYELTAGRTYVWADMIDKYLHNSNFFEYIIGRGDDKTYYYNSVNPLVRNSIWAHSDYLQILVGKGAAGLIFYVSAVALFSNTIIKKNTSPYKWLIILMIVVASILNGFYSYRDTTMAIPLFGLIGLYYGKEKKVDEEVTQRSTSKRKRKL